MLLMSLLLGLPYRIFHSVHVACSLGHVHAEAGIQAGCGCLMRWAWMIFYRCLKPLGMRYPSHLSHYAKGCMVCMGSQSQALPTREGCSRNGYYNIGWHWNIVHLRRFAKLQAVRPLSVPVRQVVGAGWCIRSHRHLDWWQFSPLAIRALYYAFGHSGGFHNSQQALIAAGVGLGVRAEALACRVQAIDSPANLFVLWNPDIGWEDLDGQRTICRLLCVGVQLSSGGVPGSLHWAEITCKQTWYWLHNRKKYAKYKWETTYNRIIFKVKSSQTESKFVQICSRGHVISIQWKLDWIYTPVAA